MKMFAFALLDLKSGAFGVPFFCAHEAIAKRMVQALVEDAQSTVSRHPEDFSLYRVGTFDTGSGELEAEKPLKHVAMCTEFVGRQPAMPLFATAKGEVVPGVNEEM